MEAPSTTDVPVVPEDFIQKDILGLTDDADTIIFISADGKVTEMALDDMFVKDKDGQRPVLAWKIDDEKCDPTLVIGQADDNDVNRSKWAKEIIKVEVTVSGGTETPDEPPVVDPEDPTQPSDPVDPDKPDTPVVPGDKEVVGDATAEDNDLAITGTGLDKDGYFTIKGLKNDKNVEKGEYTFSWMNKAGMTGRSVAEGATMQNLLDILGITEDAESVTFKDAEGEEMTMTVAELMTADKDGQYPVLAWKIDGEKCDPTLVVGQADDADVNKSAWFKNIVSITVNAPAAEPEDPTTPDEPVVDPEDPTTPEDPTIPEEPDYGTCPDCGFELDVDGNCTNEKCDGAGIDDSEDPTDPVEPEEPAGTDEPADKHAVDKADKDTASQTGDDMNMAVYFGAMILALVAAAAALFRRREN